MNYEVDNGFVCFEFNLVRDNQTRRGRAGVECMGKLKFSLHRLRDIPLHGEPSANERRNMFCVLAPFMKVNSRKKYFFV